MVNNSKILTVSYGTFSCTLEGFDDSFGTMKAIAEYFRDLAADDRYFGAEPPAPDAEMLARIAEREIARRVEAHREDNTFVLRAESQDADTAESGTANEDLSPPHHEQPLAVDTSEETEHARVGEVSDTAGTAVEAPAEDIAAASETAEPQTPAPAENTPEAPAAQTDSGRAENQPSSQPDDDMASQRGEGEPLDLGAAEATVEESLVKSPAEQADDAKRGDLDDDQADPAPAASPEFEADSVAAKLQRIRDVVSRNETASTGGDYTEDEHANDILSDEEAATEDFLASAQDDISAALAADDEIEAVHAHEEEPEAQGEAEAKTDDEADSVFNAEADAEDADDISALLDRLSASDAAGETDPANDTPKAESVFDELEDARDSEDEESAPVRARVIKMKKTDFDAAVAEGQLEEDLGDEDAVGAASSLSPDEEDELMRELAAVEAELADGKAQDSDVEGHAEEDSEDTVNLFSDEDTEDHGDDAHVVTASTPQPERSAQLSESGADAEMGRILDETNTKLEEDEGRGRRSAIAHLRAAVKATKAERDMGGDLGAPGRDTEAYRDDLETAVRPRRPMRSTQTERPRRTAPLKLVAEQRVDTPKPGAPVKPRRVSVSRTTEASAAADGESFADYVETVGAHNLSEVLEAAASYMAFIEGQDAFSRPQLMQKLGETDHARTSREDRLRSFGQLLRAGKIRKIGGGRFEAAEDISYRPAS